MNQNVLLSAEMLNMLNVLGKPGPPPYLLVLPPKNSTCSAFPLKEAHSLKKMFLSGEMLNMLNSGGLFNKNVLLSEDMLNMLNMLNVLGKAKPGDPPPIF